MRTTHFSSLSKHLARAGLASLGSAAVTLAQAPVIDFDGDPLLGEAPLTVQFQGWLVEGRATSADWDFGDGGAHGQYARPSHVYETPGTYDVTVAVDGPDGPGALTKSGFVVVTAAGPDPPVADFTGTPRYGVAPLTVNFVSEITGEWEDVTWDFGDGFSSFDVAPQHVYDQLGTYSVSLTATGAAGSDAEVKSDYITVTDAVTVGGNVLLILCDDIGSEILQIQGEFGAHDFPLTPAIDSFAASGLLFENAYAMPLCSPSRATILTGRYPFRTGIGRQIRIVPTTSIGLLDSEVTIAEALPGGVGGYRSAAIGKWHLENSQATDPCAPIAAGFTFSDGFPFFQSDPFTWESHVGIPGSCVPELRDGYLVTDQIDTALGWIGAQSRPWFCYLSLLAPGGPDHAPPAPLQYADPPVTDCAYRRDCYKAAVEVLDHEIERLLAGLPVNWEETTTIFLVGDNGTPHYALETPFDSSRGRGTVFERGINVPLLVAGAAVATENRGARTPALVSVVDLFATICAVTATPLPPTAVDSVDFLPVLQGPPGVTTRDWIFAETFPNFAVEDPCVPFAPASRSRAVRDARYKLFRFEPGGEFFVDLETNPLEDAAIPTPPSNEPALSRYQTLKAVIDSLESGC